jgi:hypothetical protein
VFKVVILKPIRVEENAGGCFEIDAVFPRIGERFFSVSFKNHAAPFPCIFMDANRPMFPVCGTADGLSIILPAAKAAVARKRKSDGERGG